MKTTITIIAVIAAAYVALTGLALYQLFDTSEFTVMQPVPDVR